MAAKQDYIAVFDSGVGGISVLRELVRQMPNERFLYFGDSANAPYGSRPTEEIRRLTVERFQALHARGLKAFVIACNTATVAAVGTLRRQYPQEIIIGIEPAVKVAAERFPHGRVVVMATEATLREHGYYRKSPYSQVCEVVPVPCPELVKFVERGETGGPRLERYLRACLADALQAPVDAVVLGCTHFSFARAAIARVVGRRVALLDGGVGTALETRRRIQAAGLSAPPGKGEILLENSLASKPLLARMRRMLDAPG